jgi:hypothetical protein
MKVLLNEYEFEILTPSNSAIRVELLGNFIYVYIENTHKFGNFRELTHFSIFDFQYLSITAIESKKFETNIPFLEHTHFKNGIYSLRVVK